MNIGSNGIYMIYSRLKKGECSTLSDLGVRDLRDYCNQKQDYDFLERLVVEEDDDCIHKCYLKN